MCLVGFPSAISFQNEFCFYILFFEFQPLSLSLVFNLKVTAEASFVNASSIPLHFCYYDLLVGASLLRLRGGVTHLPEDVH